MQGDFRIGDWVVRPQINAIERDGKTRHLEPKVMQVLVQLATHPNEVLSKDRLLEAVWHGTFVGDDVLVRCISEIRYAFGDEAKASRVIQTIPKSGYRLIAKVSREATERFAVSTADEGKPDDVGRTLQQIPAPPEGSALRPMHNASEEQFHVLFATEITPRRTLKHEIPTKIKTLSRRTCLRARLIVPGILPSNCPECFFAIAGGQLRLRLS